MNLANQGGLKTSTLAKGKYGNTISRKIGESGYRFILLKTGLRHARISL